MTHTVVVGGEAGLVYTPSTVTAQVGDTIQFEFHAKNHTATQSSFQAPCTPLDAGQNSGFNPVDASLTSGFPTFNVTVKDTNPIWFYCQQSTHCAAGMVFAVNAPATGNTFDAFKQPAMSGAAPSGSAPAPPTASDTGAATPSASATPGSAPNVHQVVVGGSAGLVYSPNRIDAKVNDVVTFVFKSKNHTATQSTFDNPCRKSEFFTGAPGFDSGFMPATDDAPVMWNVTVNDTTPIWVYCRQANHCGSGMVFAINSDESGAKSFGAFQALAKKINGTSASGSGAPAPSPSTAAASQLVAGATSGLGALALALAFFF
jgi:plastocyanin